MKPSLKHLVCLAAFAYSASSLAAVQYSFTGFFSNNAPAPGANFTGGFSFIAADYLGADTDIAPSAMLNCHAGDLLCSQVHFYQDAHAAGLTQNLGVQAIGLADAQGTTDYYYFSSASFATPGTHGSLYGFNPATLTVSAVPEPASYLGLLAGLAMIGTLARRRAAQASRRQD